MVAKYYVAVRPQINEDHAVHKEGCPFLSEEDEQIYLGKFGSGCEAVRESHYHFTKSKTCLFCSGGQKTVDESPVRPGWSIEDIIPAKLEIPESYRQNLFFCLN